MNFCKDCKHFRPFQFAVSAREAAQLASCAASAYTDPVTGVEDMRDMRHCSTERLVFGACRPEGNNFVPAVLAIEAT